MTYNNAKQMGKYNQTFNRIAKMYSVILDEIEAFDKKVKMYTPDSIQMRRDLIERRDDWRLYMGVLYAHKLMEDNRLSNVEISQLGVESLYKVAIFATANIPGCSKVKNLPFPMMRSIIEIGTKYANRLVKEREAEILSQVQSLPKGTVGV